MQHDLMNKDSYKKKKYGSETELTGAKKKMSQKIKIASTLINYF